MRSRMGASLAICAHFSSDRINTVITPFSLKFYTSWANKITPGDFRGPVTKQRRLAIILRQGGVVFFEAVGSVVAQEIDCEVVPQRSARAPCKEELAPAIAIETHGLYA
jgi:hypothetical protein